MPDKKQYKIGIDIGGTKMSAILFDGKKVIADYVLATPKDNMRHFLVMIGALLDPLFARAKEDKMKVKGIGVGIPGILSSDGSKILKCPNVSILDGVNLSRELEKKFKLPVVIDNDTNCFTRAEAKLGVAKKYHNVFGVIIGTGVGGAWWFGNKIYIGAHSAAGEPGRMIVDAQSGLELEGVYHKLMQKDPENMANEVRKGNEIAEKAFHEFSHYLGISLANIVNIIDPEIIVLGGGATESSELFLPETQKIMREYIMSEEAKKIEIKVGSLGAQAGAIGAALLVI